MNKILNRKHRYQITGYFAGHQHSLYGMSAIKMIWLFLTLRPGADMRIRRSK